MVRWLQRVCVLAVAALAGCGSDEDLVQLAPIGAQSDRTSVSGLSAGAYMAGQFQIAHSGHVVGAGIIAGGPYGCGQSQFTQRMSGPGVSFINMGKAINGCMKNNLRLAGVPNVARLAKVARELSQNDSIAPLQNLERHRVYLYSADADQTVVHEIVSSARDFYEQVGVPPGQVVFLRNQSGAHAFITDNAGLPCGQSGPPYLNDCDLDQAGAVLKHIRGSLKARTAADERRFVTFDQRPFTSGRANHSMAESGAAYIPERCTGGQTCQIHIVFHGCGQGKPDAFAQVVRGSGYAEWAEANDLVVLFPRTAVSPANPAACWDWWGYTGAEYLTRKAPQIGAVKAMLDRLAARPAG